MKLTSRISRVCLAAGLLLPLAGCEVTKTEEGRAPDVDVDPGRAPEYDVDTPDVDVHMEEKTVDVPDVDVHTEEKTVTVPDVDITPADEDND